MIIIQIFVELFMFPYFLSAVFFSIWPHFAHLKHFRSYDIFFRVTSAYYLSMSPISLPKMNSSSSKTDPVYGKSIFVTPCLDLGINECALSPPFPIYTQPCIPIENIDITRRPVAFGRLALPKLVINHSKLKRFSSKFNLQRRELHDEDTTVVLTALTSLCDLCHDPEKGYEAIRLRIIDRLDDITTRPEPEVRERAFLLLKIIAGLGDGKEAIVTNGKVLERLKQGLLDVVELVRVKVTICLEEIASYWKSTQPTPSFHSPEILDSFQPPILWWRMDSLKLF